MQTYHCQCGNALFFDNSVCLRCNREVGHCPACHQLSTLIVADNGSYQCGNEDCGVGLLKCLNYAQHNVCNRCLVVEGAEASGLCDCCRFNNTIPDLTVPGNLEKWYRLEAAKRRLFYDLNQLGLPYGTTADGVEPPLAFDFKADAIPAGEVWRSLTDSERVYTGHANGLITINIREADDVEREKQRAQLGENKRTLIGHFRHEIGHFYWDVLVKDHCEDECRRVFGDHDNPLYDEAMQRYYEQGPAPDWPQRFVSAYASMHPWEDFAETWATYLAMVSELDTAHNVGIGGESDVEHADPDKMIERYQQLGVALNEMNRSMGLIDVVPEIIVPPVVKKIRFIHDLIGEAKANNPIFRPPAASDAETAVAEKSSA